MLRRVTRFMLLVIGAPAFAQQQVISTIAGTNFTFPPTPLPAVNAPLGHYTGVAVDASGNVYVADTDNNLVERFAPRGQLTIVAGNGIAGFSGDGGPANRASLNAPYGVAVDSAGNLYIADTYNSLIRKVSGGIITTVAGNGFESFSGDGGPAVSASLFFPQGVAVDSVGNLYIADTNNLRIRRVSGGTITTVAGNGKAVFSGDGGPATNAAISALGVAVDLAGNLYIADLYNNRIRKVAGGTITTIAGNGNGGPGVGTGTLSGDGGPATSASLDGPSGVAVDSAGNLYIGDTYNDRIRKVSGGTITTVAGGGSLGFSGDGGPATSASLSEPAGVAVDSTGNLYISDSNNDRIREVSQGTISTVAGNGGYEFSGDGGPATSATFNGPQGVAVDSAGTLYIADTDNHRVRKVSGGTITTAAGNGAEGFSGDGGPGTSAMLNYPAGLAVDSANNLYIGDTLNAAVRKLSGGTITTVVGNGNIGDPGGVAVDAAGDIYIADYFNNRVRKASGGNVATVAGNGTAGFSGDGGPATSAALNFPSGVAVDSAGNLYIADANNNRIRKVSSGTITTVAGNGANGFSGDGGPAASASLNSPLGIAVDSVGDLYIADKYNNRIRKVSGGIITTVAGTGDGGFAGDGGPATSALLSSPDAVAVDSAGNLYIADTANNRIREVFTGAVSYQGTPSTLSFSAAAGAAAPAAQTITLSSSVAGLSFTTSTNATWLSVSPSSGSMPSVLQVAVNPTGLTANTYQGIVTINAPNASPSTKTVTVSFTISGGTPSQLAVSIESLPFSLAQGASPGTAHFTISNTGSGSTRYTAAATTTTGGNWLQVSTGNGSVTAAAPFSVGVIVTPGTLAVGTYNGAITVTGPDTGQTLIVTVILAITSAPPKILLSQLGFTFTAVAQGGTVLPQTLGTLNSGAGTLSYSVQATTQSGGSGWLSVSPTSGTVIRPLLDVSFIDVNVNTSQLPPQGTYYGQIVVTATGASNSPQTALVVLNVLAAGSNPGPDVRPTGLVFIGVAGAENPGSQNVTVANVTGDPMTIAAIVASPTVSGLIDSQPTNFTVPPESPASIVVQPNFATLSAGQYRAGMLVYTDSGPSQTVNILSVVAPSGTATGDAPADRDHPLAAAVCPTRLLPQFTATGLNSNLTVGYPASIAATVVDDCGFPMTSGSVVLSFDNGDPPISLIDIQDGNWQNSWQPSHPTNSVTLTLTATSANLTGTATASPGAVQQGSQNPPMLTGAPLGAGTVSAGPFAPGDLMLLKGTGLADGQASSTSTGLQNKLAGAQVAISQAGFIPLLYADAGQVVGLVPANLLPGPQEIILQRDTTLGVQVDVIISTTHPAILTADGSGQGQGSIYTAAGAATTLANAANPANSGAGIIIYCIGLGATNASGSATNVPTLTIGGQPASITYAGVAVPANYPSSGAPTLLGIVSSSLGGLYQINAMVPAGAATGSQPVIISSAGQTSQSGVTMTIAGSGSNPNAPAILAGGIVNAASYAALPVSPGSLVAIFTSPLAAQPASFSTASLPPSLGGVSITFNGIASPMVGVSPSGAYPFISAQVPFEVLSTGQTSATVPVVIKVNGVPSAAALAPIVASSPGIFTIPPTGQGNAVLVNLADYSIAAPSGSIPGLTAHPIPRGQSAFFYVTGLGAMTPPVSDGTGTCPAPTGLCPANAQPTVFVGGVATQASAVQAPGFPGVFQINITIPQTTPTGTSVPLIVKSADGTVTSNIATIAVQ